MSKVLQITSRASSSPACVHRQLYTIRQIFELEMARIFAPLDLHRPREPGQKAGDYFATQIAGNPVVMTPTKTRASCDPQPMRPPRRHGGGDREGQRGRVHLLLSRLDYSSRRPAQAVPREPRYPRDFRVATQMACFLAGQSRGLLLTASERHRSGPDLEDRADSRGSAARP